LAELRLLRFLFGAVTASHDELRKKVRVLAKAKKHVAHRTVSPAARAT
jgi:hypothetical protein